MYSFTIDHIEYDAYKDGTPFTLVDCWREVTGVGHAKIWCGDRLVLDNAGAVVSRRYAVKAKVDEWRIRRERRRGLSPQPIFELIERRGWSDQEAAEEMGITSRTLVRWRSGEALPTIDTYDHIAVALGHTAHTLWPWWGELPIRPRLLGDAA